MKKIFGLMAVAMLLAAQNAGAQSYAETAMMFSRTKPSGSARIMGMGGAQVSLGGDFSSAYSNPAGLGMYNRSEFSFSPGYANISTSGDYFGGDALLSTGNNDSQSNLNMGGLGFVFSRELEGTGFTDNGGYLRGTFAITMTRTNNFFRNAQYDGRNPNTSLIDYFLEDATGDTPAQFDSDGALYNTDTELAYLNYLIGERTILDPNNDPTTYFTDVTGIPFQSETIEQEGGQTQWNFSYGANFGDKFYLGAGLGIASVKYRSVKHYREDFEDDPFSENDPLDHFILDENLDIRGTGVNLTVGSIVRPVDFITIGVSAATPTYYSITDTWSADMNSSWKNFEYLPGQFLNDISASTDELISEYDLSTPWRLSAGATIFIQKQGLITFDVESVNYGKSKYKSNAPGISYEEDNDRIKSLYESTLNIRLGGELRLNALRLRAGIGAMGDPYVDKLDDTYRGIASLSGGVGYRAEKFFIDLAYVRTGTNSIYRPYSIRAAGVPEPMLNFQQTADNFIGTVGFTF